MGVIAFSGGCAAPPTTPAPTATARPTARPQATPTVSPTPTRIVPTKTPAPGPRSFAQDFRTSPPYWTYLAVENGQSFTAPSVQDGFLVFDLAAADQWAYALYTGHQYWDVTVQAHAQLRTTGDGAVGLVCRYDTLKGWYEFNIYADRSYALLYGQWLTNGVARYTPLYKGQSDKIQSDENELGLGCQGDDLTPFVNGTQLRTWQELKFGLTMGQVGMSVSSFEDFPFTVGFDWAKVSEP